MTETTKFEHLKIVIAALCGAASGFAAASTLDTAAITIVVGVIIGALTLLAGILLGCLLN